MGLTHPRVIRLACPRTFFLMRTRACFYTQPFSKFSRYNDGGLKKRSCMGRPSGVVPVRPCASST